MNVRRGRARKMQSCVCERLAKRTNARKDMSLYRRTRKLENGAVRRMKAARARVVKAVARTGTIAGAARPCKVDRASVYRWRADDPVFEAAIVAAQSELADRLEETAIKLATAAKSDGEMLRCLLRGNRPEKYDRARAAGGGTFNTQINMKSPDRMDGETPISPERAALLRRLRLMCLGAFPEAVKAASEARAADRKRRPNPTN